MFKSGTVSIINKLHKFPVVRGRNYKKFVIMWKSKYRGFVSCQYWLVLSRGFRVSCRESRALVIVFGEHFKHVSFSSRYLDFYFIITFSMSATGVILLRNHFSGGNILFYVDEPTRGSTNSWFGECKRNVKMLPCFKTDHPKWHFCSRRNHNNFQSCNVLFITK